MYNLLAAVISSLITLTGVIITCIVTSRSTRDNVSQKLEVSQAVTDTKIDELTREVRLHNNFAQRMPVVEEQIRVINHRVSDIERGAYIN